MAGAAERQHASTLVAAPLARASHRFGALGARALAVPPPLIALALAGVALAGHYALWGASAPWGRAAVAGTLLAAAGWAGALWAVALLRAAGTPICPTAMPVQLIEEGPYRFSRNPMYLGLAAVMLGAALGLGVPLLALGATAFAALVRTVHIPHEEAQMTRRFGGWYRDYTATTRRWL